MDPARRALLAAAAALPACSVFTTAEPPRGPVPAGPAPAPAVRVGDRWRYRVVDRHNGRWLDEPTWETVEAGSELRLKVSLRRATAAEAFEERYATPWAALTEVLYGLSYPFRDPVPLVPATLEPGRVVATSTSYLDPVTQRRRLWSQQLRVGAWESLEVPAGRYDCLRIGRTVAFEHTDTGRRASTLADTLWYAPAVNRWVQRELRGEYISAGTSPGTPAEGERGLDDWLLFQLTAYQPSPR